ncbi:MAG TPA: flagellar hook-associated protein FlgK [Alphaproteobacteria bacterium]|nr:flagellar hook-associated protein FlgK [Alphaproteobacteria bacterium]
MGSLTGAINTANSALRFNQNAISTVSNNIANANTVGYTRQVITAENNVIAGQGQGVTSGTIIRYADQNLQSGMDQQKANLTYNKTISNYFDAIEKQFGKLTKADSTTTGSSLDGQISDMFSQLNNLVQDPTLSSNRVTFKNSSLQTTDRLNRLSNDLAENQISIDDQITNDIAVVNASLKNISELNSQIAKVERANGNSSDLRDLRQKEIDKVSEHYSVKAVEKEDGVIHLSLDSGKVLVDSSYVKMSRISGSPFGGIGFNRVLDDDKLSTTTQILTDEDLQTGNIGALIDLRDKEIPDLLAQLDNFATSFMEEFNNVHAQGSAVPPPAELASIAHVNAGITDLVGELGLKAGTDFDISIVDKSGNPVATTANLPYVGSVNNSTVVGTTTGTFDPDAYLAANGANAQIEGTSNLEYLGANMYRVTDPSGGLHTATLTPGGFPVGGTPAQLDFGNGMVLNVDPATAEPVVGNIGTIDTKLDSGPVRVEAGDTLDDLATKINNNAALAGQVTATVENGALVLKSTIPDNGVVLGNDPTGDTFNHLGFNRYFEGTSASDITVSSSITSNLNNIATGRMGSNGGFTNTNNENAVALVNLQNTKFSFNPAGSLNAQDSTLSEYFISITSSFAANVAANTQQQDFNQSLYNDFNARVQSVSGVNTDEEFSNLIVYQRGFEASSRMIKTIDQMLETLINMV